jgi:hypothetical protein
VPRGALNRADERLARKKERDEADRAWSKAVLARDHWKCRVVGHGPHEGLLDAHHVVPRSLSRASRHDRRTGIAACRRHHTMITAHQILVVLLQPAKGADGRVRFEDGIWL